MPCLATNLRKPLLCLLAGMAAITALGAPDTNSVYRQRAEIEFHRTRQRLQTNANRSSNAWVFAHACYDLTELAATEARRAEVAKLGIAACQQLLAREPKSAPGHYYLAMNDGALADAVAPSLTAYELVHEIEHEFKTAQALDEKFDFAGSARSLGMLYRDAPGWPWSIGNKWKARAALERAAAIAPDYPDNQLDLAESYLQWREREGAEAALKKTDAIWAVAQTNLTGVAWEMAWRDWAIRRTAAKNEFQTLFK